VEARTYNLAIARANTLERTTIRLCGEFSAIVRGRVVTGDLGGRQGRAVFASLVLSRPQGLARDQLIDVLWPAAPPKSPERGLDVVVSRLRTALGQDVVSGRSQLTLTLDPDAVIDVEIARRRVRESEAALVAGDAELARDAAHEGLDVLAGPLLPGLEGPWLDHHRARLAEIVPRLLRAAARAGLALGGDALDQALTDARALVAENPFSESASGLLMEVQAARGDVAEALQTYEELRVRLLDQLGNPPAKAIADLHARLLRPDAEVVPAPAGAVSAPEPALPLPVIGTTFVGRAAQLEALRARWATPPRLVFLSGEAGIGKTTLAARFAEEIGAESVLFGRCDEDPIVPYQPFVEAFRHPDALSGTSDDEEVLALAPLIPRLRSLAQGNALGASPELQRYLMFEAVAERLRRWSRVRPLLFILDDVHWADKPTVKLLQHLVRNPRGLRLMVIATYRTEDAGGERPLADLLADLRRAHALDVVRLEGLSRGETDALITERLEETAPDFAGELWSQTDGNPLFIEEALRSVEESGQPVSSGTLTRMGVPDGVKSVIVRRLETMPLEAADALRAAATIGQEFDPRLVAGVRGVAVEQMLDTLERAPARGLIAELERYRYAFSHGIVRMAIYEDMGETRRAELHHRVGVLLESAPERPGQAAEVALHLARAGELADPLQIVEHERRAGEELARSFAYEDAATHFERAAETLGGLGAEHEPERCAILLDWARCLARAGLSQQASAKFHEAAGSAVARGDAKQLTSAAVGLGQRYWEASVDALHDSGYRGRLDEALALLPPGDSPARARLLAKLAEHLAFLPREADRAAAISADALAMARRVDDRNTLVAVMMARHATRLHVANTEERLRLMDEVVLLRSDRPELSAEARMWRIYDLCELGEMDAARAEQRRLSELARELRQPLIRHVAVGWESLFAELAGDVETTERLSEEFFRLGERAQAYDARSTRAAKLFAIYRWQGRLEELRGEIEALASGVIAVSAWRAALALLRVVCGDAEEGLAGARALVARLPRIPADFFWLSAVTVLSEAVAVSGDAESAEPLYDALAPFAARYTTHSFGASWGSVERPLGLLAATSGRRDRAEAHLRAALAANRAIDAPMLVAITECDLGELTGAPELGASAERTARRLGLSVLEDRAAQLAR
jgi:DNA-binding SARP family transcriptional activator